MRTNRLSLCLTMVVALFTSAYGLAEANGNDLADTQQMLANLDTDRDGMVSVFEIHAYLDKQHGKDYNKALMQDMESSAYGKSCSSPFAKPLY